MHQLRVGDCWKLAHSLTQACVWLRFPRGSSLQHAQPMASTSPVLRKSEETDPRTLRIRTTNCTTIWHDTWGDLGPISCEDDRADTTLVQYGPGSKPVFVSPVLRHSIGRSRDMSNKML